MANTITKTFTPYAALLKPVQIRWRCEDSTGKEYFSFGVLLAPNNTVLEQQNFEGTEPLNEKIYLLKGNEWVLYDPSSDIIPEYVYPAAGYTDKEIYYGITFTGFKIQMQ